MKKKRGGLGVRLNGVVSLLQFESLAFVQTTNE